MQFFSRFGKRGVVNDAVRDALRLTCIVALSATALVLPARSALASTWAVGDVFLAVPFFPTETGTYEVRDQSGELKEVLADLVSTAAYTSGCAFDKAGNLFGTHPGNDRVVRFDNAHPHDATTFGSGYSAPLSIAFDQAGNVYVGNRGNGIRQYDASGTFVKTIIDTRVDWLDIAADQDTIVYTQGGADIKRVSIATVAALRDFTTGTAVQASALRILPDGGVLLADRLDVKRYNSAGEVVQTYDVAGEDFWFSLSLDPNGTSFWAGNVVSEMEPRTTNYYRLNMGSGVVEVGPINADDPAAHHLDEPPEGRGRPLFGVCVFGEPTAATTRTTTTTTTTSTTTTVAPVIATCKPGWGFGDRNHCHSGPPRQLKKAQPGVGRRPRLHGSA